MNSENPTLDDVDSSIMAASITCLAFAAETRPIKLALGLSVKAEERGAVEADAGKCEKRRNPISALPSAASTLISVGRSRKTTPTTSRNTAYSLRQTRAYTTDWLMQ